MGGMYGKKMAKIALYFRLSVKKTRNLEFIPIILL